MGKSTEGVVLKDGQIESLSNVLTQLDISSAVNDREIEARSQFVQQLKKARHLGAAQVVVYGA